MERIPASPPVIYPLPADAHRPRWSVMIPVFNCAHFLTETLTSVLAQDPGPEQMQIEVIDDASSDADVETLVARLGQGRVGYFRQSQNVGSLRNFETCLQRSRGELVHLLHGDDRVLPGFYVKLGDLLDRYPQAGAAFCNYYNIDERSKRDSQLHGSEQAGEGLLNGWLYKIATRQRLQYVSMVVRRRVYEEVGGFYGVTYGEDWEMWVRIASRYAVAYTPARLAEYRYHSNSISSEKASTKRIMHDLHFVIDRNREHLPENRRDEIWQKSMNHYMGFELYAAFNTWKNTGNFTSLRRDVKNSLNRHSSLILYLLLIKLFFKKGIQRFLLLSGWSKRKTNSLMYSKKWDWEITSENKWWQIGVSDIFTYRNLLFRLIRRDFLVSYQQTLLGPFWAIFQPILTVLTYVVVFNKLVGISTGSVPPALFYLTGTVLWSLFNDVFNSTSVTFTANADLFSKVYFPRLVIPLSAVSAQLIRILVQLVLVGIVLVYYSLAGLIVFQFNSFTLLLPMMLLLVAAFGLATGLIFSVLTARYRDLTNMVMLIMRMLMFVTPVIYPLAIIPEKTRWLVALNPLTPMFELFRYALFSQGDFTLTQLFYSISSTCILLLTGIFLFNKQKETLMDIL